MCLEASRLQQLLSPRPFKFYAQIESTQDIAVQWLREDAPSGAVVIADEQLTGRGRHGRSWLTPPGVALALSVILRSSAESLPQITMLGAVAIAEMLTDIEAPDVTVKWPNDVCLSGRKVAGVLPEVIWEGNTLCGGVLGIGVNVRNDFSGTELEETAISIEGALGRGFDRVQLIITLLTRIDHWHAHLGTSDLIAAWRARLETLGQTVMVTTATGVMRGVAESVDKQGALILNDSGIRRRVVAGEVWSSRQL